MVMFPFQLGKILCCSLITSKKPHSLLCVRFFLEWTCHFWSGCTKHVYGNQVYFHAVSNYALKACAACYFHNSIKKKNILGFLEYLCMSDASYYLNVLLVKLDCRIYGFLCGSQKSCFWPPVGFFCHFGTMHHIMIHLSKSNMRCNLNDPVWSYPVLSWSLRSSDEIKSLLKWAPVAFHTCTFGAPRFLQRSGIAA